MEFLSFKDKLFAKAKENGFTEYEIYFQTVNSFGVKIFKQEISQYNNSKTMGVSFRGLFEGKMGYSYSEKIEEDVIDILVKNASENAKIMDDKETETLFAGEKEYDETEKYKEDNTPIEEKISIAKEMEKWAFTIDKRVISIDHSSVGTATQEWKIINSKGLDVSHKTAVAYAFLEVRLKENEQTKIGEEIWFGNSFEHFDQKDLAKKAVEKGASYLGAAVIPNRVCPAILLNDVARTLFSAYSSIFFAENVQKGLSLMKGKIGQKVASHMVTIRDDGILNGAIFSLPFDGEGVATKNKTLIENGVLKTYLYNLKSAQKDGVKPTGNGFKASLMGSITTGCTNFYMLPSDLAFNEMVGKMGNGVIITELAGLHSGCNVISGDFSLSAEGFLVEGGKITKPIEQITIAGNFLELLQDIEEIGGDFKLGLPSSMGTCHMPSLLLRKLKICGV